MDSKPVSLLPKNFNYYAGGHIHYIFQKNEPEYGTITFPGALFPANFSELEKYGNGGFYIVTENSLEWIPVLVLNTFKIKIDCAHKNPAEVTEEIMSAINGKEFINTIVTVRVYGKLESGKISDIKFNEIFKVLYDKSAYFVMKNTSGILTRDFEEIKISADDASIIEDSLINEHLGQIKVSGMNVSNEKHIVNNLFKLLSLDKLEGERVTDFEFRIKKEVSGLLW